MRPLKLRDNPASPVEAIGIELLRSIGRYEPPGGSKQRVRMRLFETKRRGPVGLSRPLVALAIILIAAGAGAALGKKLLTRARAVAAVAHNFPHESAQAARLLRTGAVVQPQAPAAEVTTVEPSKWADPSGRNEVVARPTPASERALVFDAMRALRREGQPARAARLLDEYLRSYPRGLLAEEALALAIEAASANGDPRTKSFADRYLSNYPEGRFRAAALRARARFLQ